MRYFAHSGADPDQVDWQPLKSHLDAVGGAAARKAAVFGAQTLAEAAGKLHDLGKYSMQFQNRLKGEVPRVDHATAGAWMATQIYSGPQAGLAQLLAYAIAGHHAGLANGILTPDVATARSVLQERLSAEYRSVIPELQPDWEREIVLPDRLMLPEQFRPNQARSGFQLAMLVRMLFSTVVDADFIDTDNYYRALDGRPARAERTRPDSLQPLREQLDAYLATLPGNGEVNAIRAEILAHVRARAELRTGLFSLTVPTGGGKTLASLAFALDHAIRHGLRRIIYVIPFNSIVEQTAAVFRNALGAAGDDAVLEHHSAFHDDPLSEPQSYEKRHLAMENWDAPIVVTTAVQFFESLHADRPSACRKLHNIAGSVVILDEAQTLPLKQLHPCVAMIDELARNYRSSVVLCTATQPALRRDQGLTDGLEDVFELAPQPKRLYQRLRRVGVRHVGAMEDAALIEVLHAHPQVLCIVNNRRHAQTLFEGIAALPGARHLSTLMHARHRSAVLAQAREDLHAGRPCRLVSTSLIEAGVDIDFPLVLRTDAGLDSIAQAAGRCNREGRRAVDASDVRIFSAPQWPMPNELREQTEVFRRIETAHRHDLLSIDAIEAYFRELYARKGDAQLDAKGVLRMVRQAHPGALPFESIACSFRMIDSLMKPIIIPFDWRTGAAGVEVPEVAEALAGLAFAPGAARALQGYLVQVPEQVHRVLVAAHAVRIIRPELYAEQFVVLDNARLYSPQVGLHWDRPEFREVESNII